MTGPRPPAAPLHGVEHVRRYRETGGADGYDWLGTTILLLTTTGRKSGERRTSPLIFREWRGSYLIAASNGGSEVPPAWLLNLRADPTVEVQIKGDVFTATARLATAQERPPMWALMVEAFPT